MHGCHFTKGFPYKMAVPGNLGGSWDEQENLAKLLGAATPTRSGICPERPAELPVADLLFMGPVASDSLVVHLCLWCKGQPVPGRALAPTLCLYCSLLPLDASQSSEVVPPATCEKATG